VPVRDRGSTTPEEGILEDETAVSPVVGVALLIGITVLLVATVGTFILGSDNVRKQPPDVEFSAKEQVDNNGKIKSVEFTYLGNDRLPKDELTVVFDATGYEAQSDHGDSGSFNASESFTVTFTGSGPEASGEKVRLVWSPEGESESRTVRTHRVSRDVTTP